MHFKINFLKYFGHLPGANELNRKYKSSMHFDPVREFSPFICLYTNIYVSGNIAVCFQRGCALPKLTATVLFLATSLTKGISAPIPHIFFLFTDSNFLNLTWRHAHLCEEQRHRAGSTLNLNLEAPQSENKNGGTGHGADFGKWQFYITTVVLNKWTVVKSVANVLLKLATLCTAFKKCYFAICCNSILSS